MFPFREGLLRKKGAVLFAQIFWHIGVQKKWHKLSKLGGGVEVIWTKSKRTATFFWETFPYMAVSLIVLIWNQRLASQGHFTQAGKRVVSERQDKAVIALGSVKK